MAISKVLVDGTEHELQTTIANVTGLQTALNNKLTANGWAASAKQLAYDSNGEYIKYGIKTISYSDDTTQTGGTLTFPAKSGTIALTSDTALYRHKYVVNFNPDYSTPYASITFILYSKSLTSLESSSTFLTQLATHATYNPFTVYVEDSAAGARAGVYFNYYSNKAWIGYWASATSYASFSTTNYSVSTTITAL